MTIEELGATVEQWEKVVEGYRLTNIAGKTALERAELQADLYAAEAQLEQFRKSLWEAVYSTRMNNKWEHERSQAEWVELRKAVS